MERAFAMALDQKYIVVVQPGPAVLIWTAPDAKDVEPALKQLKTQGYETFDCREDTTPHAFLLRYFCEQELIDARLNAPTRHRPTQLLPGETEDDEVEKCWH